VEKAQARIRGFMIPFLIVFRFLYGLRSVTPFVVGMSDVPAPLFLFLNALGAMIWAVAVGTGGYLFGNVLEIFIANVKRYELYVFVTIAAVGAVIWIVRLASRRRRAMPSNKTGRENGPL
jgi:membrane protein DedA with SNARE-associated domain